ncbi:hypothetical protein [Hymenobacter coalescens]
MRTFTDAGNDHAAMQSQNGPHAILEIFGLAYSFGYTPNGLSFLQKHIFSDGIDVGQRFQSKFV